MNWIPAVIAAISTIVGVLIGGWLNHHFAIRAIFPTTQIQETAAAYADYIDGAAGVVQAQWVIAQAQSAGAEPSAHLLQQETAARSQVTAAKARIAVYGHPDVIAAMANFEKEGAQISPANFDVFALIMFEMREHITNEPRLHHSIKEDIKIMIFGFDDRGD